MKIMTIWHLWQQNEFGLGLQSGGGSWFAWSWSCWSWTLGAGGFLWSCHSLSLWGGEGVSHLPFFIKTTKLNESYVSGQQPSEDCLISYHLDESSECRNFVYPLKKWGVWPFPVVTLSLSTWVSISQISPGLDRTELREGFWNLGKYLVSRDRAQS